MAEFDFIHNRAFDDRFSAFAPQTPQAKPGSTMFDRDYLDTGVKVLENGDVAFGFYAPDAQQVSIVFGVRASRPLQMEKQADGVWRAHLAYDPYFCGPKAFHFQVDGAVVVSPYCPQYYSHGMAINYVEIPDPNAPFVCLNKVPHGAVTIEFYWSHVLEDWQRCLVYTPPGYQNGGAYPVFYLQHGSGENETSWVYNGKAGHIMDNLIAEGKAVPCIIVMNDGMVRGKQENAQTIGTTFARSLLECCMPFIEEKYRTKQDKWSRAIAGFSMGSMQACVIGLENLDKFAYIGLFSGFMRKLGSYTINAAAPAQPEIENTHLQQMDDREAFTRQVRLFYRAMGTDDYYYDCFGQDDALCRESGYDQYPNYVRRTIEHYPHDWAVMRILLHDFAQRIFRE